MSACGSALLAGPARTRVLLAVALATVASLLLYLQLLSVVAEMHGAVASYADQVFPWVGPLAGGLFFRPQDLLADAGRVERHTTAGGWFLALLLGLFSAYGLALRAVAGRRSRALEALVLAAGAAFLAIQALGPAMLSGDLFSYVLYGRIFALYGDDPYLNPAAHYTGDPYLRLVYWRDVPSFYGPLWTLLSGGLALLGGERMGLTVLLFRGLAIAAALAAGALLWATLRRMAPERAAQGLVFFLWNPLLVLETGLSGHNDAVMAVLLLLGVWLHLRGRCALAVMAMSLSAMVKFVTVPVLALYVLLVLRHLPSWRERCRNLAKSSLVALVAVGGILAVARAGPQMLSVVALGSGPGRYTNSLHELLVAELRLALGEEVDLRAGTADGLDRLLSAPRRLKRTQGQSNPTAREANTWLRLTSWAAFGAFGLLAAVRTTNLRTFLVWSAATLLASYWLVSAWFLPWYVIWALALAALVPTSAAARLAAILSATVFSIYFSLPYIGSDQWWIYTYRSLPAFVLPLMLFGLARLPDWIVQRWRTIASAYLPAVRPQSPVRAGFSPREDLR
jgi:hypothetical protein